MGCAVLLGCAAARPAEGRRSEGPQFDQSRAWASLVKQCDFGPRVPGTPAQLKCRDYILAELAKSVDDARLKEFSHTWSITGKPIKMWNVIGEQNWKNAKVRVVLTTHWDSRPFADQDPNPDNRRTPILGADDGASGVAVMLELARVLKGLHGDVGIQYVFTDGEDLGPGIDEMLLGATDYMKHLPDPRPDYGILLDMIGCKNVVVPIEPNSYAGAKPLVTDFYAFAKTVGLASTFPDRYGEAIEDDHLPMIQAGIPTMDLIDFDYPSWHTIEDKPDKCSAESLGKIGLMLQKWLTKSPAFVYPPN